MQIVDALQKQNAVTQAGFVETSSDRIRMRVTGSYDSVEQVRNTDLRVNGQHFRLGDIARVSRGLADPANPMMRFDGQPAIGLGVVMNKGGDVVKLGEHLRREMERIGKTLPVGLDIHVVADQSKSWKDRSTCSSIH